MNEPLLLLLCANCVTLLILGCVGALLPRPFTGAITALLCAAGAALCLLALINVGGPAGLQFPPSLPRLSLALTLDPVNAVFLFGALLCGAAVATAATVAPRSPDVAAAIALTLAGLSLSMLAAGAVTLAVSLAIVWAGLWRLEPAVRPPQVIFAALMILLALCVLAPDGSAPDFAVIRADPPNGARLAGAALLGMAGSSILLVPARRSTIRDPLIAGALGPAALYLLTRLLLDLPGPSAQAWWGDVLMLAGAMAAVCHGWRAAGHPDIDGSVNALVRLHGSMAVMSLGVCIIGQTADLPEASSFALAALFLLSLGASVAGTLGCLAATALAESAGTSRLARLGGLMQTMPIASAALSAALIAFCCIPPGLGFAGLWLAFQALLSGPRVGGLLSQVPTALAAASLAASAALATTATIRVAGIALLGRPRSARASAAVDVRRPQRAVLLALAGLAVLIGILPGVTLRGLAQPAVRALTGSGLGTQAGWMTLSASPTTSGYATVPVLALLLLATGAVVLVTRHYRSGLRLSSVWNDGHPPAPNLPFGDPTAQSAGTGFRPALPDLPLPHLPLPDLAISERARPDVPIPVAASPPPRFNWQLAASARAGLWTMLAGLGVLMLLTALHDTNGP